MDTEIDWQRELDASFGTGDDLATKHYVAVGRQAVRRRRATWSAGVVAAAVVVGLGWALAPGGTLQSKAPVATDPSATPSPTSSPTDDETLEVTPSTSSFSWRKGAPPARATPDGLEIRKGAIVHRTVNDLFPGKSTSSAALDVSYRGERWWMSFEWDKSGAGFSSTKAEDGLYATFDDFVLAEKQSGGMTNEPPAPDDDAFDGLVKWTGGVPAPLPGVVVVREVRDPLPASSGSSIGLVLQSRGETTWMLIAIGDGGSSTTSTLEADSGWATFDQWLADEVALQTGEPGLRLVTLQDDGTVKAARADVRVVDQQSDPDLRAYGSYGPGPSAVALVDWEGERWFVLAVGFDGPDAYTTVAASKADGAATLDEFVAFMADKADEGGMR